MPKETAARLWAFRRNGAEPVVTLKGRLRVSAAEDVRAAVLANASIAVASEMDVLARDRGRDRKGGATRIGNQHRSLGSVPGGPGGDRQGSHLRWLRSGSNASAGRSRKSWLGLWPVLLTLPALLWKCALSRQLVRGREPDSQASAACCDNGEPWLRHLWLGPNLGARQLVAGRQICAGVRPK
jgi:hypothetical protein